MAGTSCRRAASSAARTFPITKQLQGKELVEVLLSLPRYPARTLGERIRRLRPERGLYQKELARLTGVDEMTSVNWEKDRTVPRGERLGRLARALGIRQGELISEDGRSS